MSEGDAYCPACWGAGQLYRIPGSTSCGSCAPPVQDWEPYPCARCAGSGLLPARPAAEAAGRGERAAD